MDPEDQISPPSHPSTSPDPAPSLARRALNATRRAVPLVACVAAGAALSAFTKRRG